MSVCCSVSLFLCLVHHHKEEKESVREEAKEQGNQIAADKNFAFPVSPKIDDSAVLVQCNVLLVHWIVHISQ